MMPSSCVSDFDSCKFSAYTSQTSLLFVKSVRWLHSPGLFGFQNFVEETLVRLYIK